MIRAVFVALGWVGLLGSQAVLANDGSGQGIEQFLPLLAMIVIFGAIFYFMLIRPQRRRQQEMNKLMEGLKRGDNVVTAGGIHGEIESIGDTSAVLVLDDGSKLRMLKTSIVRKVEKS